MGRSLFLTMLAVGFCLSLANLIAIVALEGGDILLSHADYDRAEQNSRGVIIEHTSDSVDQFSYLSAGRECSFLFLVQRICATMQQRLQGCNYSKYTAGQNSKDMKLL